MEQTRNAESRERRWDVSLPAYRWGDIGLCTILALAAYANIVEGVERARANDALASAHDLVVGMALGINAFLLVIRGPAVSRAEGIIPRVIAILGSWLLSPLSMLPHTWENKWVLGATTLAIVAAYLFAIWALLTLRRSFSVFPEARQLVRRGPYALVRHPLYAAYILTYACVLLPRLSPLALVVGIVGIGAEMWRARFEERLLGDVFPEYATYAKETPRFVPAVFTSRRTRVAR